jgi:hypothetical protein
MKKRLTLSALVALALALPIGIDAQVVVGFGGGFRSASITLDPDDGDLDEARTGIGLFGFVGIPLSETFRVQPGLSFVQKGASESQGSESVSLELDYFEIPILGVFSIPSEGPVGFHVFGGPTIAFEAGCSISGQDDGVSVDLDCTDDLIQTKSIDFGLGVGAAVSYATSETMNLFLSAFYGLGLTNIADAPDDDQTAKNRALGIDVGVSFVVGG